MPTQLTLNNFIVHLISDEYLGFTASNAEVFLVLYAGPSPNAIYGALEHN